jgi:hypothetical protein
MVNHKWAFIDERVVQIKYLERSPVHRTPHSAPYSNVDAVKWCFFLLKSLKALSRFLKSNYIKLNCVAGLLRKFIDRLNKQKSL